MCGVQLLRVSVHERMRAAAEDVLLRVETGEEAALRALLTERLTAAAEEIVGLLEETVAEYEDRVERSEREICRQRRLLEAVLKPQVRLHRADLPSAVQYVIVVKKESQEQSCSQNQEEPEPPHIKEEQEEPWTSQEDEEKPQSSQLHRTQTEQMKTEADGEDCGGPEPDRNSDPDPHLQPDSSQQLGDSSEPETDDSADWKETEEPQSGRPFS
ncbi:uncharacterized protein LOC131984886 [Centropristis striata]|uniref:uncharacterized protein LOC131984886 n=1 Tax=Centropristis striata TaxID=184440 RepID=UPI0027E17871|nr:uncharacterized protein LOC131984886 [Centropristis striata]